MNKAVFLDRDGTINVDKDYLYKQEDFEYLPGAIESLKRLDEAGFLLIVITNQSGIARGYYSEKDYHIIDEWMKADLLSKGVKIAGSYYCPHHPDAAVPAYRFECKCRKPGTELFWRAQRDYDIDMSKSYAIGDRLRDLAICDESPTKGIILGANSEVQDGIVCCNNWQEAADMILNGVR